MKDTNIHQAASITVSTPTPRKDNRLHKRQGNLMLKHLAALLLTVALVPVPAFATHSVSTTDTIPTSVIVGETVTIDFDTDGVPTGSGFAEWRVIPNTICFEGERFDAFSVSDTGVFTFTPTSAFSGLTCGIEVVYEAGLDASNRIDAAEQAFTIMVPVIVQSATLTGTLTEASLFAATASTVTVTLTNTAYAAAGTLMQSHFSVTDTVAGTVSVSSFTRDSDTGATLTLAYSGEDITAASTLSVTLAAEGHIGADALTTNTIPIAASTGMNICGRTTQVRDAIVAVSTATECTSVTAMQLASITTLALNSQTISTLLSGDFDGLTGLTSLDLAGNSIATLPEDIFDGLMGLTSLDLSGNRGFTTLPEDIFDGLTALESLSLFSSELTALPANIFDGLMALESLLLFSNRLTGLPADIFDGLDNLMNLVLSNNPFTAGTGLPSGVFDPVLNTLGDIATSSDEGFVIDDTVRAAHFVCSRNDFAAIATFAGVSDCLLVSAAQLATALPEVDATLSALTISDGGVLDPAFDPVTTTTYTVRVANSVTSVTVTPTATQSGATITVNGEDVTNGSASNAIDLPTPGTPVTVTIVVTAADDTNTETYVLMVTRALPNTAPTAMAVIPVNAQSGRADVYTGTVATLDGSSSSDADVGDSIAAYAWTQTGATATSHPVTLSDASVAMPTFMAPVVTAATDLEFSLTVTDTFGAASAPATATMTVNLRPRLVISTEPASVNEGSGTITIHYTVDPNGGPTPNRNSTIRPTLSLEGATSADDFDFSVPDTFVAGGPADYQGPFSNFQFNPNLVPGADTNVSMPLAITDDTLPETTAGCAAGATVPGTADNCITLLHANGRGGGNDGTVGGAGGIGNDLFLPTEPFVLAIADNDPTFSTTTIADQTYIVGVDIGSVTLPTATGGNPPLAYTISALPDGLTLSDNVLSGIPETMQVSTTHTYTVTDGGGSNTDTIDFMITINANTAPTAMAVIPVNAQSGRADVYTGTVATLDGSGSSDPDAGDSIATYAWTQTGPTATSHPVTLSDASVAMPTFMAPAEADITAATDLEFSLTVTDTFGAASAPATATITVNLRPRLVISTEPASANEGSSGITIRFTVDPNGGPTPNLGGSTERIRATLDLEGFTSADDFNLFNWVPGGSTDYQFQSTGSFGPNLMPGDNAGSAFLQITDDTLAETTTGCTAGMTIPATADNCITIFHVNALGTTLGLVAGPGGNLFLPAEPLVVAIADNDPTFSTATIDDQTYTVGVGIGSVTLPTATGGNPPLAYTISSLPDGLTLSDNVLSGIPETMQASTTHTYTVTDSDSNTATIDFTITIGANTITGVAIGAVTEDDSAATATGTLTVTGGFIPQTGITDRADGLGTYGNFTLDATSGVWIYTLNNDPSTTQGAVTHALAAGDTPTDIFTAVSATDVGVTRDVIITVTGTNDAPTANAGPDQPDVISGATVTLDGSGSSDPDTGNTIDTYTWMQTGGTTVTLSDNSIAMPTFTAPTVSTPTTLSFTLVVNDGTADSPADTVDIIVSANNVPDFASATIDDQTYTEGGDIGSVTLPTATGGDGALSYALTPMLPDGLTFTAADRTLTGTPAAGTMQDAATYTYTVSDSDANVAATDTGVLSFTIAIGVNTAPTAMAVIPVNAESGRADVYTGTVATLDGSSSSDADAGDSIAAYAWTQTEPTATSHPVTLSDASVAMPTFMAPAVTAATDLEFSLTVTDTFGVESAPATATITVNLRPRLVISTEPASVNEGSGTIAINYTVDPNGGPTPNLGGTSSKIRTTLDFEGATSADDFNLFGWVPGGTTDYQFEFTSSFGANLMPGSDVSSAPLGITDDALAETTTGCTAGTTIPGTTDNCITIFHINALGTTPGLVDGPGGNLFLPAEPLVVAIADNDPIFSTTTIDAQTYTVGVGIGSVTLPTAIGGNPPLAYTISALPDGLSLSDNVLSGIPETMQAVTTHTYTVTDGGGSNTDTIDFTITIDANTITGVAVGAVTEDDNSAATATGTLTLASEDFIAQDGTTDRAGGLGTYGDFVLNATSGEWTYTLDNTPGDTQGDATNALAAGAMVTDVFTAVSTPTTTVRRDVIITVTGANDAPTANAGPDQPAVISGATVTLDGSGSSDPDTGDMIDTYTWTHTGGTPSVSLTGPATAMPTFTAPTVSTPTTLTFTLVVNDGTADSLADTVDIIVNANTVPDFASATIADQTYTVGGDIGSVTLPTATGGDGALSYALTPMLPDGLTFTAADRTLTGTPAAGTMQAATTYTYTVGDADTNIDPADTDTLTFTITVNAAGVNPAGVTVDPMTLSVPEADGTGTYTVVLDTEPTGDVTITPVSGDTMAATVSGALTFTTTDWNTAQTVTVTGVDDTTDNPGDARTVTVTHAPTGADTTYNLVVIDSVTVTVEDDDVAAGVTVDPTSVTVPEASGTNTYTVVLDTQPTGDVTITPVSGDTMAATVSSALTFTTTDWNTAQTVTVTGVNDNDDNPGNARTATVTHAPTGADSVYNSVSIDSVTVTVTDDDGPSALLEAVSPTTLGERRLNSSTNRATVQVTLMDTVYVGTAELTGADFMLTDTVDGEVTVESAVTRDSDTVATLTLGHSSGISNDGTVSVTVLASAHIGSGDLPAVSLPIDATAPTVSSVAFSTTGPYGLGADIEVTITFSEDVFVEETTPNALLDNIGTRNAVATPYNRGDGSNTLVFRYTVVLDDTNANGVNIRRAVLESGGGIIRDAAGNDVVRDPSNSQIIGGTDQRIDTSIIAPPSITIAADTSPVTEGTAAEFTLTASAPAPVGGLTVTVSVSQTGTFIEGPPPTTVTIAAAATTAALTVATTDDNINEAAGSVTATVTAGAGYTVGSPPTASVTVEDDDASATLAAVTPLGEGNLNRPADTVTVTVTLMNTMYMPEAELDMSDFMLTDDVAGDVTVSDVARTSGRVVTLRLTHDGEDITSDGELSVTVLASAHTGSGDLPAGSVPIDATAPTVVANGVAFTTTGPYGVGADIEVTITFNENVFVTGVPNARLFITPVTRDAAHNRGSGSMELVFRYTVVAGDTDTADAVIREDILSGGGGIIRDAAGNDAVRTSTNSQMEGGDIHRVDTTLPMLSTATVDGDTLTLTYTEALDTTSTPANNDYVVTVATAPVAVNAGVTISGMTVTLTLATAVTGGQVVTLDYTPGTNPVRDTARNNAASLSNRGVSTTVGTVAVSLDTIAGDDIVNIAEKAAGFTISGTMASGATGVSVTIGTGMARTATLNASSATWTIAIPGDNADIIGTSVNVVVTATMGPDTGTVSRPLTVDLVPPAAVTYTPPPTLTVGTAINIMPSPSADIARYAVQSGTIPPGLTLAEDTGVISGAPTMTDAATATVDIRLTDGAGNPTDVQIIFPAVGIGSQTLTGFAYTPATVALNAPTPPVVMPPSGAQTPLTYITTTSAVCTVDNDTGALTLVAAGDCVIRVEALATSNYNEAADTFTITVSPPAAGVTVDPTELTVPEDGTTTGTYTVVLNTMPANEVTITVASSDTLAATVSSETLTFTTTDWNTAQTVTVTGVSDTALGDRTVTLSHTAASTDSNYNGGAITIASVTVTVTDDDVPAITIAAVSSSVTEGAAATFTLTATPAPAANLTVTVTVTEAGTFISGAAPATVTIPSSGSVTLTVLTDDDSTDEANGTITATVTAGTGYTVGSPLTASVTVEDNDGAPVTPDPAITIAAVTSSVTEGAAATFTLTATPAPAANLTVMVTVTETGTFINGAAPTTVTIPSSGSATLTVLTTDDATDEANGTITATVTAGTGYTVGSPPTASVTVEDNDGAPDPAITIAAVSSSVTEGAAATFTLTATPAPAANLTVMVTVTETGTFINGAAPTTVTIPSSGSATLTVLTTDDATDEANGTITATVTAGSGYTVGSPPTASVTVEDNDGTPDPAITIAAVSSSVTEGAAATFTLTATPAPAANLTVTVTVTETGTFISGAAPTTVTIPSSGSVTLAVPTTDDSTDEANGTITATVTAGSGYTVGSPPTASVTVEDDDGVITGPTPAEQTEQLHEEIAPQVVQAIAGNVVAAVGTRIETTIRGAPGGGVRLDGQGMDGDGKDVLLGFLEKAPEYTRSIQEGTLDWKRMLANSSFSLNAAGDGNAGGGLGLWGSGHYTGFDGDDNNLDWDGDSYGFQLGADTRWRNNLLTGVSVSWNEGDVEYIQGSGDSREEGDYTLTLTGIHPYVGWSNDSGSLSLWGSAGYADGKVEIEPDEGVERKHDTSVVSLAGGFTRSLTDVLSIKGDFSSLEAEIDEADEVLNDSDLSIDSQRVRLLLEVRYQQRLPGGGTLARSAEVGYRLDEGDSNADTDGTEVGVSMDYHNPDTRLTLSGKARGLVGDSDYREWGISGLIRLESGTQGLSFTLEPGYGDTAGSAGELWQRQAPSLETERQSYGASMKMHLGYGLHGGVMPYTEVTSGESLRSFRMGVKWQVGKALDLNLFGEQYEADESDNSLQLEGKLEF